MGAPDAVKPADGYRGTSVASRDDVQEARLEAALRAWWREDRPAWTEASWWDLTLHEDVRRLLWLTPGHHLVTALAELPNGAPCTVPHDDDRLVPDWPTPGREEGWPCACLIVTAAAWDACASWLATRCASSLIAAAGPNPVSFDIAEGRQRIEDPAREELAHALRTSIPAMGNRIAHARDLTAHPRLLQMVESAAISAWAGRLVLDHVKDLEDDDADRIIEDVASRVHARLASGRRPYHSAEVNRIARAARLRACPDTDQQARVRAFATRRVTVHHAGRGMATLVAELADVDAHRIHRRLTAVAAGLQADTPEDARTRDQLRADVLTDLLLGPQAAGPTAGMPAGIAEAPTHSTPGDPDPAPARPTGPAPGDAGLRDAGAGAGAGAPARPEIQVIVTLETLLGLTDDPAEVCGLGPIPADVARALASDGRWRAWITDAAGAVTVIGQRGYVPNAALARLVRAREPHCRFPGCRHPAARCDLDHAVPWPHGPTSPANLGPLCRRHHNLKTHTPWSLDPEQSPHDRPPGAMSTRSGWLWRTPAGLTIVDGPGAPLDMP